MSNSEYSAPVAQPSSNSSVALWRTLTLVLAVVLIGVVLFMLMRGGASAEAQPASQSASESVEQSSSRPQSDAQPQAQTKEQTQAQPQGDPEFAPSATDPKALEILRAEPKRNPADNRAVGKVDAPVVMIEFTDYSCPVCTHFAHETHDALQKLVDQGMLRIEYRDLVIFERYGSNIAAAGGWAAAEQGKFKEYRDAVWAAAEGHAEYSVDSVVDLAKTAGVPDLEKFRASVESAETKAKVEAETKHGYELGLRGTPFIMINDTALSGAYPVDFVVRTIEEQAKLVK